MKEIFGQPYGTSDELWVVKAYFEFMYKDGYFFDAMKNISKKWGFSTDTVSCSFPDKNSLFKESHFDGVEFSFGAYPSDEVVVVSESACLEIAKLACMRYLELHPDCSEKINAVIEKLELGLSG
ncbi:ribonuclease toxin immunity protein CdiI [Achromobacter dolens]|uniref:ribonuclease toxin immunity protein CdiI n=1 Tax=Achromobacter dolens TaxID=1287738 RepID=UPI003B9CA299